MHIQPGHPMQNGRVESFNGRLRDEWLNTSWFWNLWDARRKIAARRQQYNRVRPHSTLGYKTPEELRRSLAQTVLSPPEASNGASCSAPQSQTLRAPVAALTRGTARAAKTTYGGEETERSCVT